MLTVSKRAIQKTSEKTVALIGNKTANRITKASKTSSQNNSVTNKEENIKLDREIHVERYISLEQRPKIINDVRLI